MRNLIRILCVLLILLLAGCALDKPEVTVSNFIEAGKKFDVAKMSENINPSEIDSKGKIEDIAKKDDDSEEQYQKYFLDYFKDNAAKITYEIKSSTIDGDGATVTVGFKYVNGGPLIKATIGEVFSKVIPLAFSGIEISEEEMNEMFFDTMKKQQKTMDESFVEKMIDIELVKTDGKWYIEKPSDELLDVFVSNFISVSAQLGESMNGSDSSGENLTFMEQAKKDGMTIVTKEVGDEITFATVRLKVNQVEERQTITSKYGAPGEAREGAKFVLVNVDAINITKKPFTMSPDLLIVDNKDRQFNTSDDAISLLDNYLDYRELSPNIKETGDWLYELPEDATSYSLVVAKKDTDEIYMIKLK